VSQKWKNWYQNEVDEETKNRPTTVARHDVYSPHKQHIINNASPALTATALVNVETGKF